MKNTLLRLQKKIPDNLYEVLRLIFEATDELNIRTFVIGAIVRDLIFGYIHDLEIRRVTKDLDLGVAVGSWAEYERLRTSLFETGRFKDDKRIEHRIWWKSGREEMKIDLVPYGGVEEPEGEIAFPPKEDFVMSRVGFAEAFEDSIRIQIDDDLTIRIASLPGLALLKFIAYNDRPRERERDVLDIWFIAKNYLETVDEDRIYENMPEDFDFKTIGVRMFGRDVAGLLTGETKAIVENILATEKDGGRLEKFADTIHNNGFRDEENYREIMEALYELKRGIEESNP
jgi:predicted nucleotidyltransferase